MTEPSSSATAIYVLYRNRTLDLSAVPPEVPVILVHNDGSLERAPGTAGHRITHLRPGRNLGFGGGVDLALARVETDRVVIVNPDAKLTDAHWRGLTRGTANELRTVALVDECGAPTSVVNHYPTAFGHLLSGYRVGRVFPRGSHLRSVTSRWAGRFARTNAESFHLESGTWSLSERWASGAVLSLATERLRDVAGFDPSYFLYFEDVDLCRRLADRHPGMELVLLDLPAGRHAVGGSASPGSAVERIRLHSAHLYAARQVGTAWSITTHLLRLRQRWMR